VVAAIESSIIDCGGIVLTITSSTETFGFGISGFKGIAVGLICRR